MNDALIEFMETNKQHSFVPTAVPENLWQSDWPWAPVIPGVEPDNDLVMSELQAIDSLFVAHRANDKISSYGHEGWAAVTLHGIDSDKTENYERYGYASEADANYHWTDASDRIPYITKHIVLNLPFTDYGRIRIMRLAPGGYIMPHTDGAGRIFGPYNFALNNPQGCEFVFEGHGLVPFKAGRGFMLDLGIKHAVYNNSDEYRYHAIIHGRPYPGINQIVQSSIERL